MLTLDSGTFKYHSPAGEPALRAGEQSSQAGGGKGSFLVHIAGRSWQISYRWIPEPLKQARLFSEKSRASRTFVAPSYRKSALGVLLFSAALLCAAPLLAQQGSAIPSLSSCKPPSTAQPWRDSRQSPQCRTLEVIHAMSREQKIEHLAPSFSFGPPKQVKPDEFGLPDVKGIDGPNGLAEGPFPGPPPPQARGVTAFPNEIALAATFDRGLAEDFGAALAAEWRGKGYTQILGPTLNIMRTWHWGRSAETYGEDPYLTGQMASAEIAAIQKGHVEAMLKHFAANDQDSDRVGHFPDFTGINEEISQRALEEIYFPGFKTAVENSAPASAMCSYNQINGTFSCNNAPLLGELRAWGFTGSIVPDAVFALHDPVKALHAGVDRLGPAALLQSLVSKGVADDATLDAMLYHTLYPEFALGIFDHPSTGNAAARVSNPAHIALAQKVIESGSVLLKNQDGLLPLAAPAVKTIAVIGAGAGPEAITGEEGPMVYVEKLSVPAAAIAARAGSAIQVTYQRGDAGIRALPVLTGDVLTPASGVGHGLTAAYYHSGDLSGTPVVTRTDAAVDFHGVPAPELGKPKVSFGPPSMTWSARWSGTLTPPTTGEYVFSLSGGGTSRLTLDGKQVVALERVNFTATSVGAVHLTAGQPVKLMLEHSNDYAVLGSQIRLGWYPPHPAAWRAAMDAAASSDVAIVFAGEQLGEGTDKTSLPLPGDQDRLIEAVAARNKHTIVVLNTSTPVAMPWLDKVAAVLECWYPGQESGAGTAALLFGDADPGGRLPMTFPASAQQGPASEPSEYPGVNGVAHFTEGIYVGYRWYDEHRQKPLFPFGFGLSYTKFAYSGLTVRREGDSYIARATVKNRGQRAGSDVVELYIGDPAMANEPPSQLKGFVKVWLRPGEEKQVEMTVPAKSLAVYDDASRKWRILPGKYEFKIGASSRDFPLTQFVDVTP